MLFGEGVDGQSTRNMIICDLLSFRNNISDYMKFVEESERKAHVYAEEKINSFPNHDVEYYDIYESSLPFNSYNHSNYFFSVAYGLYEATMLRMCHFMDDDDSFIFQKKLKRNATIDNMKDFLLSINEKSAQERFQAVFSIEEYKRIEKYNKVRNILMHRAGALREGELSDVESIHAKIIVNKKTFLPHEKHGVINVYPPALEYAIVDYIHFIFNIFYFPKKNIHPKN